MTAIFCTSLIALPAHVVFAMLVGYKAWAWMAGGSFLTVMLLGINGRRMRG